MHQHDGQLKCLIFGTPICSAVTKCVVDFDNRTVVLYLPEGWHAVLREGVLLYCCPSCWKTLKDHVVGKVQPESEEDFVAPAPGQAEFIGPLQQS